MEFVESGDRGSPELRDYLEHLLNPYLRQKVTAVVLGCTHYPFIKPLIASFFPKETKILDGNGGTVRQLKRVLKQRDLLKTEGPGTVTLETSGNSQTLSLMKAMFEEAKGMIP